MRDWKEWAKKAGIRAFRTIIQAGASAALVAIGEAKTIGAVDWVTVASTAGLAAIISLLMALKGLPELDEDCVFPDDEGD